MHRLVLIAIVFSLPSFAQEQSAPDPAGQPSSSAAVPAEDSPTPPPFVTEESTSSQPAAESSKAPSAATQQTKYRMQESQRQGPNLFATSALGVVGMAAGVALGVGLTVLASGGWVIVAVPLLGGIGAALGVIAGGYAAEQHGDVKTTLLAGLGIGALSAVLSPVFVLSLFVPPLGAALIIGAVVGSIVVLNGLYFSGWTPPEPPAPAVSSLLLPERRVPMLTLATF